MPFIPIFISFGETVTVCVEEGGIAPYGRWSHTLRCRCVATLSPTQNDVKGAILWQSFIMVVRQ